MNGTVYERKEGTLPLGTLGADIKLEMVENAGKQTKKTLGKAVLDHLRRL